MEFVDNTVLLNLPNLDHLDLDELTEVVEVLSAAQPYAFFALQGKLCRLQGNIELAKKTEEAAEGYYNKIPQNYRW